MMRPVESQPGIYGKLPSNGDFVTRRLPAAFRDPWDQWLQEAVSDSRDQLGERWLEAYLTSPIWRFALSGGLAGQQTWAGLLMPSVDRVGRYFPLTVACPLPPWSNPIWLMTQSGSWYEKAENLLRACLEEELDLSSFDRRVAELGVPLSAPPSGPPHGGTWTARRLPLPKDLNLACPELLNQTLGELFFAFSLWWSRGSDLVEPSLLVCQGLPPSGGFAAMLAGERERSRWNEVAPPRGGDNVPERKPA